MFGKFFSNEPSDKKQRDKHLINPNNDNPFPGRPATATPDNPPSKLFGRDKEIKKLEEYILSTSKENRPLIIIQGETGMGKSALTTHVFDKICKGNYDKHNRFIYSSFLEAYGDIRDFRMKNFYLQVIRSLEKFGLLPKIVARMAQLLGQSIIEDDTTYFRNNFNNWDPYEDYRATISRLNNREESQVFVEKLLESISMFYPQIQRRWNDIDYNFVKVLLYSQSTTKKRMEALNAIQRGTEFEEFKIKTDSQAKEAIHSFISLLTAIEENSVFAIFIDQLEELFDNVDAKKISAKFFTLLLTLRQVPNIAIILSGNLQSYSHLTDNLNADMADQMEQWHNYLHIHRLEEGEVTLIIHYMLSQFWNKLEMTPDPSYPYYPLSADTISYLYQKYDRNLRRTLIGLHDIFNDFKTNHEVKDLTNPIAAIGDLNIIHNSVQLPLKMQEDFKNYLLSDEIQDKRRAQIPEDSIYKLIKVLQDNTDYISDLSRSPRMSNSGRKPDIYYKLGGNLFHSDQRKIGIEVKCYRQGEKVERNKVEKTIELLKKNDLDYVIWVSNVPLHSEAIDSLSDGIKERHIGVTPQTDEQLAYTYWGYIFEEAMGRQPSIDETFQLLEKIGISRLFLSEPKQLIETEQLRKSTEPEEKEERKFEEEPSIEDYFSEDQIDIGIDLHNNMREFILKRIDNLIKDGRKRIRKDEVYNDFLDEIEKTENDIPQVEFIEILEKLADKEENFRTTQKMIMLEY